MKFRSIRFEWKFADLWLGVFWKWSNAREQLDVWICFLPCIPLHLTFAKPDTKVVEQDPARERQQLTGERYAYGAALQGTPVESIANNLTPGDPFDDGVRRAVADIRAWQRSTGALHSRIRIRDTNRDALQVFRDELEEDFDHLAAQMRSYPVELSYADHRFVLSDEDELQNLIDEMTCAIALHDTIRARERAREVA